MQIESAFQSRLTIRGVIYDIFRVIIVNNNELVGAVVRRAQINTKCSPKGDRADRIWRPVHYGHDDKDRWRLSKSNDKLLLGPFRV